MRNTKPFVAAAFMCEKVLQEPNNVFSAIRIVDTYYLKASVVEAVAVQPQDPGPVVDLHKGPPGATHLDMFALVILKAGAVTGAHEMSFVIRNPDGKETIIPAKYPVAFIRDDPADGTAITIRFVMSVGSPPGIYWLDVLWDREALTSIPIRLARVAEAQVSA